MIVPNYNFLNLDSNEFEQVCAQMLSIELGKDFITFAPGPDGGVDIKQSNGDNEIIGQAKRYKSISSFDAKAEYCKIAKIDDCRQYYLFFACPLSHSKKTEIFMIFKDCMKDESNIYDSVRLSNLLEDDKFKCVLEKHFKLWASSEKAARLLISNDVLIDTSVFRNSVKRHEQFYVETADYFKALEVFEKERILLIKGSAGVGKTTISEMLVLSFLNKHNNARFVYSSSGNIESLKKALTNNPDVVELVLIDDFLGDLYLDLKGDRIKGIVSFINYFKESQNKFLIINSRIVILEDAKRKYMDFRAITNEIAIRQIELLNLSKKDKAEILYNHIYFSEIPEADKKEFLDKKMYVSIVEHPHYNPRLIEAICNNKQYSISGLSYETYVADILDNQEDTWSNAFDRNLLEQDRMLLLVLYSFGIGLVRIDALEKAFIYEIKKNGNIDLTNDVFNKTLKRLSNAFININAIESGRYISFLNPSVKDCVARFCVYNTDDDFLFFEQYLKIWGVESFLKSKKFYDIVVNNELSKISSISCSTSDIYSLFFANNLIIDNSLERLYLLAVSNDLSSAFNKTSIYYNRDLFLKLINSSYTSFYNLSHLSDDELVSFVKNAISLLQPLSALELFKNIDDIKVKDALNDPEIIETIILNAYDDYDKSSAIERGKRYVYTEEGKEDVDFDEYEAKEYAVEEIYNQIYGDYIDLITKYSIPICESDVDGYIASDDFQAEFEAEYKDYDSEYYHSSDNFDDDSCYLIFKNLLR